MAANKLLREKANKNMDGETKKEKLLGKKKKFPSGKILLFILVAVALPVSWLLFRDAPRSEAGRAGRGTQVMERLDYQNQSIAMTKVTADLSQGSVSIPLDIVKKNKLVYFEYTRPGGRIPLLAYITPSGKLVTAVSVCEPCKSTSFHIESTQMVCNACFTRWELETLKGISGGCLTYPPDVLTHTLQDGKIFLKEIDLQNWKPRVVRG